MPRELTFTVESRQAGEPWRLHWRGHGETVATDAARALASERRVIPGASPIAIYPRVRVRQGKTVVLDLVNGKEG